MVHVDETLANTRAVLVEVQSLLAELSEEIALVKEIPSLKALVEEIPAVVTIRPLTHQQVLRAT